MTPEETARAASYLEERGLIDFLDVSMGGYFAFPKMIGGMFEPAGYELATSAPVTAAVKVPRIVTGRFRTLEEVSQVIAEGTAELEIGRADVIPPATNAPLDCRLLLEQKKN